MLDDDPGHALATLPSLADLVEEYDEKLAGIPDELGAFKAACARLRTATAMGSAYGGQVFSTSLDPIPDASRLARVLLKSAWRRVYDGLQIERIATAKDKARLELMLEDPPVFSINAIRDQFADYLLKPRFHILRGLAEVFCDLDPAFKSHSKVKIGVEKLPKRVIVTSVEDYRWGRERLKAIVGALRAYRGQPMPEYREIADWVDGARRGPAILDDLELRRFMNGNGHIHFQPDALADINRALAEFYGDVLPDAPDEGAKQRTGSAVSKDLQYYPTPKAVIDQIFADIGDLKGKRALEPSCGCGRIMDALRGKGAQVVGFEVDPGRAAEARGRGHNVLCRNFLAHPASPDFDLIVMNPPFYGQHYHKHVEHALRFLKPGGELIAILPATARYDHGLMGEDWIAAKGLRPRGWGRREGWLDLPVGAFAESGTNINTTVFHAWKKEG